MKTATRIFILIAGIVIFVAGFLTGIGLTPERQLKKNVDISQIKENRAKTASVMIDTGVDLLGFSDIQVSNNDTVWSILEKINSQQADLVVVSEQYQDMGVLIKSIKGFVNGVDGKYWQYWVNNKYADKAADKQNIVNGDVIMWKFTSSQFKKY